MDLFEVNTGSLLSNSLLKEGKIPRISARSENNGVIGYFDTENLPEARHFENFISVNFFGADGGIFYHPYKASVEMKVHVLKLKNCLLNHKRAFFLCASLKSALHGYNYGNQLSSSKLKSNDIKIKLPVTQDGKPDYAFMESFIAELEAERIKELEAYYKVTGLKDYRLTPEEQATLEQLETVQWGDFRLGDLFEILSTKKKFNASNVKFGGKYRYVARGESNNGIKGYIDEDPVYLNDANTISFGQDTATIFYQNEPYFTGDKIKVIKPKSETVLNKETALLIIAAMKKAFSNFSWGSSYNVSVLENIKIKLPVTSESKPDYAFMERFIHALQKVVISHVVDYTEQKIEAHKKIVCGNH